MFYFANLFNDIIMLFNFYETTLFILLNIGLYLYLLNCFLSGTPIMDACQNKRIIFHIVLTLVSIFGEILIQIPMFFHKVINCCFRNAGTISAFEPSKS